MGLAEFIIWKSRDVEQAFDGIRSSELLKSKGSAAMMGITIEYEPQTETAKIFRFEDLVWVGSFKELPTALIRWNFNKIK